jgi:hypothetical protein
MENTSDAASVLNDLPYDLTRPLNHTEPAFFPISLTKLIVLSICTFGFYQVYWFFQNWQIIKIREHSNISATWRALLAPLFCYSLFKRISQSSMPIINIHPALLAIVFFILSIIGSLPSYYSIIWQLSNLILIPVQIAVNHINRTQVPDHDPNARFSILNIVIIIVGLTIMGLALFGSFIQ